LFATLFLFFPPLALGFVAWETTSTYSSTMWATCLESQNQTMDKSIWVPTSNCNAKG
jgi:hypothetical protein